MLQVLDASAAPTLDEGGEQADPGVAVLSRENVGPYDLAKLLPNTVEDLRAWLDENGYQIPAVTMNRVYVFV